MFYPFSPYFAYNKDKKCYVQDIITYSVFIGITMLYMFTH